MKRIVCFLFLVLSCGIIYGIAVRPNPVIVVLVLFTLLINSIFRLHHGRAIFCHIYLLFFCLGIFSSSIKLDKLEAVSKELEGKQGVLTGQISEDIVTKGGMTVFVVYVHKINIDGSEYYPECKVKIVDYRNDKKYIVPFNSIEIEGEFKSTAGYKNTGMYNYEMLSLKENICGTFVPYFSSSVNSYRCEDRYLRQLVYGFKSKIMGQISSFVDDKAYNFLKGILFGDVSEIDEEEYKKFQYSGIVHIFAVSGYNIWLIYRLLCILLYCVKKHNRTRTAVIIGLLGVYTVMSGLTASVVRAFIMLSTVLTGRMIKRQSDPLTSLCLAGIIILIINPIEIISTGFQLSFAATSSIILLLPLLKKIKMPLPGVIKEMLVMIMSVQIGIIPLIAYYFNQFQVMSVFSNFLIIPLVSIITILGMVLCITSFITSTGAIIIGKTIGFLTSIILLITDYISSLSFSRIDVLSPNILELIIYYLIIGALFGLMKIRKIYIQKISFAIFTLLLACMIYNMQSTELKISFVDVGQGDSILITTPDKKHILIDGGGKSRNAYSSLDIGEDILKPYLLKHGVNKLDLVVLTHFHDDHLNGLIPVLKSINADRLVVRGGNKNELQDKLQNEIVISDDIIYSAVCGDVIDIGKYIKLYVLNPDGIEKDENNASIVIKLVYKEFSALFTGDIGSDVENRLVEYDINSDILKIPHHGSVYSLSRDFFEKVSPSAAVICVGDNSFGHPSKKIVDVINEMNVMLFRTDINGEVIVTTRGKGFKVRTVM